MLWNVQAQKATERPSGVLKIKHKPGQCKKRLLCFISVSVEEENRQTLGLGDSEQLGSASPAPSFSSCFPSTEGRKKLHLVHNDQEGQVVAIQIEVQKQMDESQPPTQVKDGKYHVGNRGSVEGLYPQEAWASAPKGLELRETLFSLLLADKELLSHFCKQHPENVLTKVGETKLCPTSCVNTNS